MKIEKYLWILFFLSIFLFLFIKYKEKNNVPVLKVKAESTIIDLGKIKLTDSIQVKALFKVQNISNYNLTIENVVPDCKCTVPNFKKTPILPNENFEIVAFYNYRELGFFEQTMTIHFKDSESLPLLLVLRGILVE